MVVFEKKIGNRLDGRKYHECRQMKIKYNIINEALSSLQISIGSTTTIISSNFDNSQKEDIADSINFKIYLISDWLIKRTKQNLIKPIKKIISNLFPWKHLNKRILFHIFILEEDGDLLTVILNGICQVIKKAEFFPEIKIYICSFYLLKNNKTLLINPRYIEELFIKGFFCTFKIEYFNKNIQEIKVIYYGNLFFCDDKLKKKILEFGKKYLDLYQKSLGKKNYQ